MQQAGPGWLARHRRRIVDRAAEQVLARMSSRPDRRRSWSLASAGGWVLATLVHVSTVGLVVAGALLTVWLPWLLKPPGVLVVLLALAVSPRPGRGEPRTALRRAEAPYLFGVLDEVAAVVGAPVPDQVEVVDQFNAFARGNRRRTLGLGSALWMPATRQARIAVLGHELGHFAHRDLLSTWWVGRARTTLARWLYLFDYSDSWEHIDYVGTSSPAVSILTAPLRAVAGLTLWLLYLLNSSSGRRQEYLADLAAVEAGGTDGAREFLELLLADATVDAALTRAALSGDRPEPWATVGAAMAAVDAAGRANRRTTAREASSRLDDSHPQTWLRLRLVEGVPWRPARVVPDAETWAAVDAELADAMATSGSRIIEAVRYAR